MTLKKFNSKHKQDAASMLLEGASVREVAKKFGVHVSTIYDLEKDRGHGHTKKDRASHIVQLRMTDGELAALTAFEVEGGFRNRSAALRSLVRCAGGLIEMKRSDFNDLEEIRSEVKRQGVNLNQIARALNKSALRGGAALSVVDRDCVASAKAAYAKFDGLVSGLFREARQKGRDAMRTGERL